MVMFNNVDLNIRKKQGNVGVAKAIFEYTKLGYTVLVPFSDSDKYDLVIDDGVSLKKVQVKTSRSKTTRGDYKVNLATNGGNRSCSSMRKRQSDDYDLLFALTDDGRCWSIPEYVLGEVSKQVTVTCAKYKEYQIG
jgi:hypothetical protein